MDYYCNGRFAKVQKIKLGKKEYTYKECNVNDI